MTTAATRAEFRSALSSCSADILGYLERRLANRDDAADLLAETLLQAWRRIGSFPDEPERQRMWLFKIASYTLANHRRGRARRHALTERLRGEISLRPVADDIAEGAAIRDAVRRLPTAQRDLVQLIHWDGFTVTEAAEILGVNPSTARNRYATARIALRDVLARSAVTL